MVSQLYHAERMTRKVCEQILGQLDSLDARRFLTTQIADEERHSLVYLEYLRRLGDVTRMNEGLAAVREGARCWRGSPYGLMVAFHVVLEGEAVGIQRSLADVLPWPCSGKSTPESPATKLATWRLEPAIFVMPFRRFPEKNGTPFTTG